MIASYGVVFCRFVIGIAFAWSFVGKVCDVPSFVAAIERFRLLPKVLHKPAAWGFLAGELAVTLAMLFDDIFALWGFLLAALMLLAFCGALASVLLREIDTSCNCFGSSEKPVSRWDLVRNAGLIGCALVGLTLTFTTPPPPGWLESVLMFAAALVFVLVWVQVREIVALFQY
ncbi:MAG: MauE/DoxX family redox-associated membrane protein [Chloroflexota bacterium]